VASDECEGQARHPVTGEGGVSCNMTGCNAHFCGRFSFDELATVGMFCNNNDDFLL